MKPQPLFQPMMYWLAGLMLIGVVSACAAPAQTPTVEMTVEAILTTTKPTIVVSTPTLTPAPTQFPHLITPPPILSSDQIQTLISPDEQWAAQVNVTNDGVQYHTLFRVAKRDDSAVWTIVDEFWQGLGASTPEILRWSNDGRFVYFANVGSADGGCELFGWSNVKRVDVTNGKVAPVNWPVGSDQALSPDEATVAYFAPDRPLELALYDLKSKATRTVTLTNENSAGANTQTGGIVWSADGQWLALTIADGLCAGTPTFSVVKLDAQTLAQSTVIGGRGLLKVLEWPEPDKMRVRDSDQKSWWIDVSTGDATTAPKATPTPKPILLVTATPTPSSTNPPEVKPTQVPLKSVEDRAPNGWWSAQGWGEFRGEAYHAEMRVTRADGLVAWVASQDMTAGLGVPVPTPLEWSQDGRYLYYTNVPLVDGYVCSIPVNGSDLWRMDLTDGSATQLVPEVGLSVSLSPDEKTFAYVGFGQQQDLVLRDLATGEERRLSLPANTQSGGIVWSLDSSVLMLTVAQAPCSGGQAEHTIVRVEAETLTQTNVPLEFGQDWTTLAWGSAGRVSMKNSEGTAYWFNPATNTLERQGDWETTTASPNREWIAVTHDRLSENAELMVIRADGSQLWTVSLRYERDGYLIPFSWSADGRYLFFTLHLSGDGCGGADNRLDVHRLDLQNGTVSEVLSSDKPSFFALSPDTTTLAYTKDSGLILRDLTTGLERQTKIDVVAQNEYITLDNLLWSPDNQTLMLSLSTECGTPTWFVRVEANTLEQTTLIYTDSQWFRSVAWATEGYIWVSDWDWNYWQLNPLTGELTVPIIVPQNLSLN